MFLGYYRNLIVVYTNLVLSITNALAFDYHKKALVKQSQYFIQQILRRNYCAVQMNSSGRAVDQFSAKTLRRWRKLSHIG